MQRTTEKALCILMVTMLVGVAGRAAAQSGAEQELTANRA